MFTFSPWAVAVLLLTLTPMTNAHSQGATSARVGAYRSLSMNVPRIAHAQGALEGPGAVNARDTVYIVRESIISVGKHIIAGTAVGAVAGVAFIALALHQCDGHSTNGIPACLGVIGIAPFVLMGGTLAGAATGWMTALVRQHNE